MKNYGIRMERLKKAYIDVKNKRIDADNDGLEKIIEIGLFEARKRLNVHEEYLYNMGLKDSIEYWD